MARYALSWAEVHEEREWTYTVPTCQKVVHRRGAVQAHSTRLHGVMEKDTSRHVATNTFFVSP